MADKNSYPLALVLTAVDRLSQPLARIQARIDKVTKPAHEAGNALAALGETAGLSRLSGAASNVLSKLGKVGEESYRLGKRVAIGLGAAAFAGYELFTRTVETGDALQKQAERLDTSVDELSDWQFIASKASIDQETFNDNLDRFSKNLGQAKLGIGALHTALSQSNPAFLQRLTATKSNTAALDLFFRGLARIKDPDIRNAVAAEAFGKQGMVMTNITKENIPALIREHRRLVGSQKQFAQLSEEEADALDSLSAAAGGARAALFTQLLPAAITITNQLTELVVTHRPEIRAWGDTITRTVTQLAQTVPSKLQSTIETLDRLRRAGQPIADLIGGWPAVFATVGVGILAGPLIGALASLTTAVVSLGVAIGFTPIGWFLAGLAAIAGAVLLLINRYERLKKAGEEAFHLPSQSGARLDGAQPLTIDEAKRQLAGEAQQAGRVPSGWMVDEGDLGSSSPNRLRALPTSFTPPKLSVDQASIEALAAAIAARGPSKSAVSVDFRNIPRGIQIKPQPGSAPLDMSLGFSMAESR